MSETPDKSNSEPTTEQEPAILDVHPPHEPVHGWRDFVLHLATITIGLLIAISLEQTVEYFHHRHLVHEARENIRHELEDNVNAAKENTTDIQADADSMRANIVVARLLRTNPEGLKGKGMHFDFTWSSFEDSAWKSARDTGALAYMPTKEVQQYADSYGQQEIVDKEAVEIFTTQSELAAPFYMEPEDGHLSAEEREGLIRDCARTYMRLVTLKQLVGGLQKNYEDTLHKG
jgi:hypothetical protein